MDRRRSSHHRRKRSKSNGRTAKVGKRKCLGCETEFVSTGPWNRFCDECAQRNSRVNGTRYSVVGDWPELNRNELIPD